MYEFEIMNIKCHKNDMKIIVYLTTIVNYHLWRIRNKCTHEGQLFDCDTFVACLIRSIAARKRLQLRVPNENRKVNRLDELLSTMIMLRNLTFSIDNG